MNRAPVVGALIFAAAAAVCAWLQLHDVPAGGSTAKAVAIGSGAVMIFFGAIAGWICGSSARSVHAAGKPRVAAAVAAGAALLLVLFCANFWSSRKREVRLAGIRTEVLTPERSRELLNGSAEELRALAYNRSCPPEALVQLAHSPDWSVRATVGGNPNTPRAVLDDLAKDGNESVRLYVSLNPARKP